MDTSPFFSIIIPTYNRSQFIGATLNSVLGQEFASYEVIVVDDGSTDNTEDVVRSINNPRVTYYKKANGERGAARNFGWKLANGKYVTFLDSDDLFYSHHLETAFREATKLNFPNCFAQGFEIIESSTKKVVSRGYRTRHQTINKDIFKGNFLACFGVFMKRELIDEIKFEEERKFAGSEDWLLWLQLSARYPFHYSNNITGALLKHKGRSVNFLDADNLLFRADFIKKCLQRDPVFQKIFGNEGVSIAYSHVLTYACLVMADKEKRKTLLYFTKAIKANTKELFTQRSLAIFKRILLN